VEGTLSPSVRRRLAPGRLLFIVDFAQIENGSLHRPVGSEAMVFDDAEEAMILAVIFAIVAAQKHVECRVPELRRRTEDTGSPLYRFFRAAMKTHGLTNKYQEKSRKTSVTAKVGLGVMEWRFADAESESPPPTFPGTG
jgi:hypothetical protein